MHVHHIQNVLRPAAAGLRPDRRGPDTQRGRHIVPLLHSSTIISLLPWVCGGCSFHLPVDLPELSSVSCQARSLSSPATGILSSPAAGVLSSPAAGVLSSPAAGALCPPRRQALSVLPGGRRSVLPGGRRSVLPGGRRFVLPGGRCSVLPGGRRSVLPGGRRSACPPRRQVLTVLPGGRRSLSSPAAGVLSSPAAGVLSSPAAGVLSSPAAGLPHSAVELPSTRSLGEFVLHRRAGVRPSSLRGAGTLGSLLVYPRRQCNNLDLRETEVQDGARGT